MVYRHTSDMPTSPPNIASMSMLFLRPPTKNPTSQPPLTLPVVGYGRLTKISPKSFPRPLPTETPNRDFPKYFQDGNQNISPKDFSKFNKDFENDLKKKILY